jgi:hypothetical protein
MNGPRFALVTPLWVWLGVAQGQQPEDVVFNATTGTFTMHRVPKRSLDAVMKSFAGWQHQVLADDSKADYTAEDGILSMECSACGLNRPSAIDLAAVDLGTLVVYEAGTWHIGIRSKDGTQDFFGILRGEIGPEPHDPARVSDDRSNALTALADLYDLAYLTQNPTVAPTPAATKETASPPVSAPKDDAAKPAPTSLVAAAAPATKGTSGSPASAPKDGAAKPAATSLAALAAGGDIEGIQARRAKASSREMAQALETAYGTRARSQMLAGQVDSALETLSAGRQSFGKSAALRDQEAHYVVIGDTYDRLRLAVKLDINELRGYLQRIDTLEANDATSIKLMLARTLSNRIADQRASGRKNIVDDLVNGGRDLFPAWADQLTQGTPGLLPQGGVEIGALEAPAPPKP